VLGYGKGKHILDEEEVQAIYVELREEQLTPLGNTQEALDEFSAALPGEEPGDETCSLSELVLDRNSVEAENPHPTLAPVPAFRPETHAATRRSLQTSERRVQARAKTRRESQPVKSPAAQGNNVSGPGSVRPRCVPGLVRLLICRNWLKVRMEWGVAALVVAMLFTAGLARFHGEARTERALQPDDQRALIKPSRLAHDRGQENTEIVILQIGQHQAASQTLAAIPVNAAEKPPGDDDRSNGSRKTAVVEAATRERIPEIISIAAAPVVDPPPVESVTPPAQVSGTKQQRSEVNGLETSQDDVAMAAPDRVLPDLKSLDSPAAGDGADQMVPAEDQPVAPTVSHEEKIATLLAQGQQSLREFRLLTPAGDNANHYFKEVLALDPGNTDARQGFNRIVGLYVILARRANARHDSRLARVNISRGLQVRPGNRDLLALQESMRKPPVTARETVAEISPAVESPPERPVLFSRLKSLFTWKQDVPAEVVERSITSVNY
jgi:hypothetical protein